ncbi:hypothetical protein A3Q56_03635 [Intoshia linei]|uniref:Uncharacterized protein n=1 Tax=Intoshia linei TaxID=1819745 RepID=A0A177B329_9BILA|nr:hypothetical protein A3Q56_03635 [Intoshia linei]
MLRPYLSEKLNNNILQRCRQAGIEKITDFLMKSNQELQILLFMFPEDVTILKKDIIMKHRSMNVNAFKLLNLKIVDNSFLKINNMLKHCKHFKYDFNETIKLSVTTERAHAIIEPPPCGREENNESSCNIPDTISYCEEAVILPIPNLITRDSIELILSKTNYAVIIINIGDNYSTYHIDKMNVDSQTKEMFKNRILVQNVYDIQFLLLFLEKLVNLVIYKYK